jgi:hypothetical protein
MNKNNNSLVINKHFLICHHCHLRKDIRNDIFCKYRKRLRSWKLGSDH